MLKFLSKRNRSKNALLIVFVIALTIGLIGFFTPGIGTNPNGNADDADIVAKVLNREVTVKELRGTLGAYAQQAAQGQGSTRAMDLATVYAIYGEQIMKGLIRRHIIQYEAERQNLTATDAEVQEQLRTLFNPWPGAEQYRMRLQQNGTTPVEFEDNLRVSIMEEKLRSFLGAATQVSPQEVEDEYKRLNTKFTIRWVEVTPDKFRAQVTVTEPDLRAFFEQRKGEFYIGEEQRRAKYLFIDQKKAGEAVQVSDDELRKEFNPEANIQQVRVSQIVVNVPKKDANAKPGIPTDAETEIAKKVEEIYNRAKGSDGKPAEDFAKLARELSEDAKTKAQGGDLGLVNKSDKRESDDPLSRVFTMKKDEVSSPIRKGDKFYIVKVTDVKTPTFEEARAQLLKDARDRKGYTKAVEIATEAEEKLKASKNPEAVLAEMDGKYGAGVVVLKETPFFMKQDDIPGLGAYSSLNFAVFELANSGDVTERLNVQDGFAIAQYTEKRDPHEPAFEEVKAKVEEKYRQERAQALVLEQARRIAQATSPEAMKAAGDAAGFKSEERGGMAAADTVGPLVSEGARAPIYKLKAGEVAREPIKVGDSDNYLVVSVVTRDDANMGEPFQKERRSIEERILQERRSTLFTAHMETTHKQLLAEGKIKIYQDVVDRLLAASSQQPGSSPTPNQTVPLNQQSPTRQRRTPTGAVPIQPQP